MVSLAGKTNSSKKQLWIVPLRFLKKPGVTCTHEVIMVVTMTIATTLKLAAVSSMHRALSLLPYITCNISDSQVSITWCTLWCSGKRPWLAVRYFHYRQQGTTSSIRSFLCWWCALNMKWLSQGLCIWTHRPHLVWKIIGARGSRASLEKVVYWWGAGHGDF